MVEVMGVSLKTENEEWSDKIPQMRGSEGGRRGFTLIEFAVVLFIISLFFVLWPFPSKGLFPAETWGKPRACS
jgi:prepilin-type N-terminal cleavage/methylation domain-containing protein